MLISYLPQRSKDMRCLMSVIIQSVYGSLEIPLRLLQSIYDTKNFFHDNTKIFFAHFMCTNGDSKSCCCLCENEGSFMMKWEASAKYFHLTLSMQ